MSKFFFRHSHSFRRENYFSVGIPLRVLAYTSTLDSFHNTHFRLFFGCFTAKHFISYHWKAIRRYSIWRSEGLATSYIAVKLDYRMWQLPEIHAKILRIKKKSLSSTRTFPTTLTSQVIYSYPETKNFCKISYGNFSGLILKLELSVNYACVIIPSWLVGSVFESSAILLSLMWMSFIGTQI